MKFRMVVADPSPVVRTGLYLFFEKSNIQIIAEAESGAEAVQKTLEFRPDLLLTDFLFSDCSGSDVLDLLQKSGFEGSVVFFTEKNRSSCLMEGIPAKISFFLKSVDRDSFVADLEYLLEKRCSRLLEESFSGSHEEKTESLIFSDTLTLREKQIMGHVVEGLGNKEIAAILGLSKDTVKEHVSNILRKLGARDRTQAAVFVLKNRIIPF